MEGEENNDLLFLSLKCITCSSEVVQLVEVDQTSFLCKLLSNWSHLLQLEAQDGFISALFVTRNMFVGVGSVSTSSPR